MTNRIGGPPPPEPRGPRGAQGDPSSDKFKQEMQKVGKVEKVGEVDLDQSRKKPFFLPNDEDEEVEEELAGELPRAPAFWGQNSLPDEPVSALAFEEKTAKEKVGKKEKREAPLPWEGLPPPPKSSSEQSFEAMMHSKEPKEAPPPFFTSKKEEKAYAEERKRTAEVEQERPMLARELKEKEEEHKERRREGDEAAAFLPVPDPLPATVQHAASEVQAPLAPYLTAQTAALFQRLVGTIFYMAASTSGISRTEIVLNSTAFTKSPFYNAKITIERYTTASDSFNIRLSGSAEAVKSFNENIPSLTAAFSKAYEDKRVKFRIGRIDTSYSSDLPGSRRVEKREDEE